jgi:hypothetical protein
MLERIVQAIVLALLDWLEKRYKQNADTMENAKKPLPPDAIAFRERIKQWMQDKGGSSQ